MLKKTNRGFSMVEILISVTVFAILMIPIVSGIVAALNRSTAAKDLQYRNEFAENLMEYVKQDSLENIITGNYFSSIGIYDEKNDVTFYVEPGKTYAPKLSKVLTAASTAASSKTINITDNGSTTLWAEDKKTKKKTFFPYETYGFSGVVRLGTKHTPYVYKVEISNQYYAEKEMNEKYVNPNNLALGVVEDIDYTKIALINGTIANYDSAVTEAYTIQKANALKQHDPDQYQVYMNQIDGGDYFARDSATRMTAVIVKGSESTGYTVQNKLVYHDNNESNRLQGAAQTALKDYYIEYTPYTYTYEVDPATGKAFLPNIYLMYNVCLYNGVYSADDYIVVDMSGVTDDTPVNLYVVQTASTYSQNLISADASLSATVSKWANKNLYNTNTTDSTIGHDNVRVHMLATSGSDAKLKNLSVYHNFMKPTGTYTDNTTNNVVLYMKGEEFTGINNAGRTTTVKTETGLFGYKNESDPVWSYIPLYDGSNVAGSAKVEALNQAKQEARGLYRVNIWMEEGEDPAHIDTSKNPIITGTKGGNES